MLLALYLFATAMILLYRRRCPGQQLGKLVWLFWTVNMSAFLTVWLINPDFSLLSFWAQVVWAQGAITLIARTIYGMMTDQNGLN